MRETVIRHDEENDILYISFHNPPLAAGHTNRRGDFLFRSKKGELIGVTVMDFSRYEEVIKILAEHKALNQEE